MPLLHLCHGLQGLIFTSLLKNPFEHLIETQRRYNELGGVFDGGCKEIGVSSICEVFQPS
jgi:hypothetical protein